MKVIERILIVIVLIVCTGIALLGPFAFFKRYISGTDAEQRQAQAMERIADAVEKIGLKAE